MTDAEEAQTTPTILPRDARPSLGSVSGDQSTELCDPSNGSAYKPGPSWAETRTIATAGEAGKPDGEDKQTVQPTGVDKTEVMSDLDKQGSDDPRPLATVTTKSSSKEPRARGLHSRGRPKPSRPTVASGDAASGLSAQPSVPCRTGNGAENQSGGD